VVQSWKKQEKGKNNNFGNFKYYNLELPFYLKIYMKIILYFIIGLLMISCSNEPSLQKFFVENAEKKDFIALDVSSSILNLEKTQLSAEQEQALASFDKMNIIAFKATPKNQAAYEVEKSKLKTILKGEEYQELMKFGSGSAAASVSYIGTEDNIKEFIFYANKKENGFAVVRVTGDNMNPTNVMTMLSVLQKSNINLDQLKPLEALMK